VSRVTRYEYLEQATATILSNRHAAAVRRELACHLDMKRADLIQEGMDAEAAERAAIASLGAPDLVADGYRSRPVPLPKRRYLLGLPLLAAVLLTLRWGPNALIWLGLVGLLGVASVPGLSLRARLEGVGDAIRRERVVIWGGVAAGVAAGLGTFGNPPPLWFEFLMIVVGAGVLLTAFYTTWTRDMAGRAVMPFAMAGMGASAYLVAGLIVYSLGHWNLPGWEWVAELSQITTPGVFWIPLLFLAVPEGWTGWRRLQVHFGWGTAPVTLEEDA
jgi:hypothetical protein